MPAWSGAAVSYELGDLVSYNGYIYKVVLAHTSVANWYPDQVWYFEQQAAIENTDNTNETNSNETNANDGSNADANISDAMPAWSGAAVSYELGDLVTYNGYIYKVVLAHISVANWYPDQVWYFEQQQ